MFFLVSYPESCVSIEPIGCFSASYPSWFVLIAQLAQGMLLSAAVPLPTSVMTAVWAVAQLLINLQAVYSDILPPRLKPSPPPLFHRRHSERVEEERVHFSVGVGVVAPVSIDCSPRLCLLLQQGSTLFSTVCCCFIACLDIRPHQFNHLHTPFSEEHSTCLRSSSCLCPSIRISCFKTNDLISSEFKETARSLMSCHRQRNSANTCKMYIWKYIIMS